MSNNEENEEDDKISNLLSEMHIKVEPNNDLNIIPTNKLALETSKDLEQELTKFRNEWKNEVLSKGKESKTGETESSRPKNIAIYHEFPKRNKPELVDESVEALKSETDDCDYEQPIKNEDRAEYLFNKGVLLEQQNRHYEAIKFYRMALQIDPEIEYKSHSISTKKINNVSEPSEIILEVTPDEPGLESVSLYEQFRTVTLLANRLCEKNFPQTSIHFSDMPIEVVMLILKWVVSDQLDMRSLENFSSVSKGFYVCGKDPELWRLACTKIWGHGNLPIQSYNGWRHMYLNRPRLNFDGAYISKTSYVRAGEQESFYDPWHLVEYYRYFRFFPNGTVIFLTCADEPKITVSKLYAFSSDQNILKGTWYINGSRIIIDIKRTVLKKYTNRYSRKQAINPKDNVDRDQTFKIELEIESEKRRLNNQLRWINYEIDILYKALNKKSHSKMDVNKVDFPLLYFSRVKSYTKATNSTLN